MFYLISHPRLQSGNLLTSIPQGVFTDSAQLGELLLMENSIRAIARNAFDNLKIDLLYVGGAFVLIFICISVIFSIYHSSLPLDSYKVKRGIYTYQRCTGNAFGQKNWRPITRRLIAYMQPNELVSNHKTCNSTFSVKRTDIQSQHGKQQYVEPIGGHGLLLHHVRH